jgi:hypothetical protein
MMKDIPKLACNLIVIDPRAGDAEAGLTVLPKRVSRLVLGLQGTGR